jgi:hypothetical protein
LLFAIDRLFRVGIVGAGHVHATIPLVEAADGGVETSRSDDRTGRRQAWNIGQRDLLAAPREPAGDGLVRLAVVMSHADDKLIVRPVGCVFQRRDRHADLGIVLP